MPWLERWTLRKVPQELLQCASWKWKGDPCRVRTPCVPRPKPSDQECDPHRLHHAGPQPRWEREDREGVWGVGQRGGISGLPSHVLCFQHLRHGVLEDGLNCSSWWWFSWFLDLKGRKWALFSQLDFDWGYQVLLVKGNIKEVTVWCSGMGKGESYKICCIMSIKFESAYWYYKMCNETECMDVPEWWNCDFLSSF